MGGRVVLRSVLTRTGRPPAWEPKLTVGVDVATLIGLRLTPAVVGDGGTTGAPYWRRREGETPFNVRVAMGLLFSVTEFGPDAVVPALMLALYRALDWHVTVLRVAVPVAAAIGMLRT